MDHRVSIQKSGEERSEWELIVGKSGYPVGNMCHWYANLRTMYAGRYYLWMQSPSKNVLSIWLPSSLPRYMSIRMHFAVCSNFTMDAFIEEQEPCCRWVSWAGPRLQTAGMCSSRRQLLDAWVNANARVQGRICLNSSKSNHDGVSTYGKSCCNRSYSPSSSVGCCSSTCNPKTILIGMCLMSWPNRCSQSYSTKWRNTIGSYRYTR